MNTCRRRMHCQRRKVFEKSLFFDGSSSWSNIVFLFLLCNKLLPTENSRPPVKPLILVWFGSAHLIRHMKCTCALWSTLFNNALALLSKGLVSPLGTNLKWLKVCSPYPAIVVKSKCHCRMHTEEKRANQFKDRNMSFMDITFNAPQQKKFGNKSAWTVTLRSTTVLREWATVQTAYCMKLVGGCPKGLTQVKQ